MPVLVLVVPIFDTTLVTLMRKAAGRAASMGGRDHTSHRLVALGRDDASEALTLQLAHQRGADERLGADDENPRVVV